MRRSLALLLLPFAGCALAESTAGEFVDHPCAAAWGTAAEGDAILVEEGAVDGDGSVDAPFGDLEAAILAATTGGPRVVLVGPGQYTASEAARRFFLSGEAGGDDVAVLGCGSAQSLILAIDAAPPGSPDERARQAAFEFGAGVQGATLAGFTLSGGEGGVVIGGGAGTERPIVLRDLVIEDGTRSGVSVTGLGATVQATNVHVRGIDAGFGSFAMGIVVHEGGSVWDPPTGSFVLQGGTVEDIEGVGVLVDHAHVDLVDVLVQNTSHAGAATGRGAQVQNQSRATFDRVTIQDTAETGLFVLAPTDLSLENSVLTRTHRAPNPDSGALLGGDGFVAVGGEDVASFVVRLIGSRFEDNGRAGGIAEDVTVYIDTATTFQGNGLVGDGETFPNAPPVDALVLQGQSVVLGLDGDAAPSAAAEFVGEDSGYDRLDLNRDALPVE